MLIHLDNGQWSRLMGRRLEYKPNYIIWRFKVSPTIFSWSIFGKKKSLGETSFCVRQIITVSKCSCEYSTFCKTSKQNISLYYLPLSAMEVLSTFWAPFYRVRTNQKAKGNFHSQHWLKYCTSKLSIFSNMLQNCLE